MIGEVPEVEGKGRLKTEVFKSFLDKIIRGRSRKFSGSVDQLCIT